MQKIIEWFCALNGADYLDFSMVILTIVGGVFALIQWRNANRIKRAEFLDSLIEKLRGDEEIDRTIHQIDYDSKWYNRGFHNGKDALEHDVDKTLSFFSYICYLRKNKLIGKRDFEIFSYEIQRIADNYSVQAYLFNLYHFSKKRGVEITFCYLFDYCYKNDLFGERTVEIKNPNTKIFPKYLNF